MDEYTELPRDVRLLWGLADAPRRGRRPKLTVEAITAAAIEVADENGLDAVSMSRVAKQLGSATMALYRHVQSKDELLTLMADAIADPPALESGMDWRADLTRLVQTLLDMLRQHPWYIRIPISGPPVGPGNLAWLDRMLASMSKTPLAEAEKLGVVMGLMNLIHGELRLSVDLAAGYASDPEAFNQYGKALELLVDPRKMPALAQLVEAGVFTGELDYTEDAQEDFAFALARYLDGVATYMTAR